MKLDFTKIGLSLAGLGLTIGGSIIDGKKNERSIEKAVEKRLKGFQPQEVKEEEPAPAAEEENAE